MEHQGRRNIFTRKGRTYYTSNAGLSELRTEICNFLNRRYGLNYNPDGETLITVGGSEAIDLAFRAMLNPGDEVIIPQPSYVSYLPCAVLADATPVLVNLKEENEFRLTPEELLSAITPKTKILVFPFPNNPTGAIMPKEELEKIAQICIDKDILLYQMRYIRNSHTAVNIIVQLHLFRE